jgi:hypothetical protein
VQLLEIWANRIGKMMIGVSSSKIKQCFYHRKIRR